MKPPLTSEYEPTDPLDEIADVPPLDDEEVDVGYERPTGSCRKCDGDTFDGEETCDRCEWYLNGGE